MERVLRVKKRRRKFEYRARPSVSPEEKKRRTEKRLQTLRQNGHLHDFGKKDQQRRKRQRLGVKHDAPIPADSAFIDCVREIARNVQHDHHWQRRLALWLGVEAKTSGDDDDLDAAD